MIIASFWIYLLVLVCLVSLWNNICITQSWWQTYAKQTAQIFKKRLSFFILITVLLSNTLCPAWLIWMNDQWACQSSVRLPPPLTSGTCVPHRETPWSPKGSLSKLCSTWSRLYCSCWKLSSIFRSIATPPRILIQF